MRKLISIFILLLMITMMSSAQVCAEDCKEVSGEILHKEGAIKELKIGEYEKVDFNIFTKDMWLSFQPSDTGSYIINIYGALFQNVELYDSTKLNMIENSKEKNGTIKFARTFLADSKYYLHITIDSKLIHFGRFYLFIKFLEKPNDELFSEQWGLMNQENGLDINILPAWETVKNCCNNPIRIGVTDTGVFEQHIDLKNKINRELSFNFVHNSNELYPTDEKNSKLAAKGGHGTAVTGIIGAENGNNVGISGVCLNASLVHMKALGKKIDNVPYSGSVAAFVKAVEYAQNNQVKIINCSFGGSSPSEAELEAMIKADDILFIIAAGNNSNNLEELPEYPACYYLKNCLVVSSMNQQGELSKFSNYGGPCDIVAPGENIMTTFPEDVFDTSSGTSMSAPFVSGVVGIILSTYPNLSPEQVISSIVSHDSVTILGNLKGKVRSSGCLNAYKAIKMAQKE